MERRKEEARKAAQEAEEAAKAAPVEEPIAEVYVKDEPLPFDDEPEPVMDFTFTVKGATEAHLEALTAFLEENGFNYTLEV